MENINEIYDELTNEIRRLEDRIKEAKEERASVSRVLELIEKRIQEEEPEPER